MPRNLWEEDEEEQVLSEEEAEQALAQYEAEEEYAEEASYEEVSEEYEEEDSDEIDESLMADARMRLEQGRLYEMLLKHSLFEGVDADPRAIKNVEKEIRKFIRERLEVLVGLKAQSTPKPQVSVSPFTELEIDMLKQLLGRVLKKDVADQPKAIAYTPPPKPEPKVAPKPVQQSKPSPAVKPIVGSKPNPAVKVAPRQQKPQPKPIKKSEPVEDSPIAKSPYEMSQQELMELAKKRSNKYQKADGGNINRIPMPDPDSRASHVAAMHTGDTRSPSGLDMRGILGHIGAQMGIQDVGDPSNDY